MDKKISSDRLEEFKKLVEVVDPLSVEVIEGELSSSSGSKKLRSNMS